MVKRTIDTLQAGAAAAPVGFYAALIIVLALIHGSSRLGSRFAITRASQKIEADIRGDLYAALQTLPPRFYAAHPTGDLLPPSTSHLPPVRSLARFRAPSIVS